MLFCVFLSLLSFAHLLPSFYLNLNCPRQMVFYLESVSAWGLCIKFFLYAVANC